MYCLFGLLGTIVMGLLGREAWNDSRAWRGMFRDTAGPDPWKTMASDHRVRAESTACATCAIRSIRPVM